MKISIITGASSGIGREFVKRIAAANECDEIWIVARREDRLNALAEELNVDVRVVPADLTVSEEIDKIVSLVKDGEHKVACLVNAAGFGKFGNYAEVSAADVNGMIDLNVRALVQLTNALIPYMEQGSRIIEMCSISAYLPLENFAIYAASKAFVLSYSRALCAELKPKKIAVTAVCPGWVNTEFAECAHNGEGVHRPKKLRPMTTPDKVVKRALKASRKNKPVSIYGLTWKGMHVMSKVFPTSLTMFAWHKMQK